MQTQTRIAFGCVIAALAATGGPAIRASAQSSPSIPLSSSQWNTFAVDVTVRASRIAADGTPIGAPAAPMQYQWERSQSGAGWKTTMTIQSRRTAIADGSGRREVENPNPIVRIEDDEDGSPLRMYGKDGRRATPPSLQSLQRWIGSSGPDLAAALAPGDASGTRSTVVPDSPRRFIGSAERDWLNAFVATPQDRSLRRTRLATQFVRKDQVRGLDRFTSLDGDQTHEILADPQSVVPVEINLLHDRTLLSHTSIGYEAAADGSLVRRSLHTERALPAATGERAVIDVSYANVRVERRR